MNSCLTEDQILESVADLPTANVTRHLSECAACARKRDRLAGEMRSIGEILSGAPPASAIRHGAVPIRPLIALAAGLLLFISGVSLGLHDRSGQNLASAKSRASSVSTDSADAEMDSASVYLADDSTHYASLDDTYSVSDRCSGRSWGIYPTSADDPCQP